MTTLNDVCLKHGADKGTKDRHGKRGHGYAPVYEQHFAALRDEPLRVLEVGVWRGASLRVWLEYFPRSTVVGVDVAFKSDNLGDLRADQRVTLIEADSRAVKLDGLFDIIIDDGSHTPQDQLATYMHLRGFLAEGGSYWVEEACRAAWMPFSAEDGTPGFRDALFEMLRLTRRVFDCRPSPPPLRDSVLFLMR
jgi:hypothetical protein